MCDSKKKGVNIRNMTIWSGNWWSEQYSSFFAKGTVSAELPDDITSLDNTEINFQMRYTGIYRNGAVENLKSNATYKDGRVDMLINYNGGILSYSITVVGDNLEGKYSLTNPYDRGSVQLRKGTEDADSSACIIS